MNHHPDIDIRWNKVTLVLSTHSEGGLTQADLELAQRITTSPARHAAGSDESAGTDSSRNASGGGQVQTRLRSPKPPSIRPTGGQYLSKPSA